MRVRLTSKTAAIDNTDFARDLGKDGKKEHDVTVVDKTVNQVRDENHGWKEDKREENNLPAKDAETSAAPKIAKIRQAAAKSVKVAVLLLGEKCPEDVIEAQASEFMACMNEGAFDRTLQRFADTEALYKKDEEKKDEKVAAENDPEAAKPVNTDAVQDNLANKPQEKPVEGGANMSPIMMNASAKIAALTKELSKLAADLEGLKEEKKEEKAEDKTAAEDVKKDADTNIKTDADGKELEAAAEEITFDGAENIGEQAPNKELEAALSDEAPAATSNEKKDEGRMAGVKSLGGQPRMASASVIDDLSSAWATVPSIGHLFHS